MSTRSGVADSRDGEVVIGARGLTKSYGSISALDGVDIDIRSGEILAIVGDNGAGKSTLVRILTGVTRPDSGSISIRGRNVVLESPQAARRMGIEAVFQDLALCPNRDVVANLFLGREVLKPGVLGRIGVLDRRKMIARTAEQLKSLDVRIPQITGISMGRLSGGQRQSVAVARSAFWASSVLFMDEPTAALGVREAGAVLRLARRVADEGVAVVLISHVLPHVAELADRVVVLRHGRKVAELTEDIATDRLVELIVGVDVGDIEEKNGPGKKRAAK
jgi:simple sugar transport system ATP-binding protein